MADTPKSFLGTGWDFPPMFNKTTRKVSMLSDEADIKSSLEILLSTSLGERVMRAGYGSNLDSVVHDPMDESLKTYIKGLITDAIYLHEPRIVPEEIEISDTATEGTLYINVSYTIPATNSRSNIVFPYYLLEGTNI